MSPSPSRSCSDGRRGAGRRTRARQPDRRAHRLQRRLRAARGHPAADACPWRPRAPTARSGSGVHSFPIRAFTPSSSARRSGRVGWVDYVKGMTRVLGPSVGGFDARIESDVPVGSGLSSSAALEIAVGRVIRELFALADRRCRTGAGGTAGRERVRGRAGRDHGPDGVQPRRYHGRSVPRHPVAAAPSACRFPADCRPGRD